MSDGQLQALRWLNSVPCLLLPNTTHPPYCTPWQTYKPATPNSFYALEKKGLAERRETWFWHITEAGKQELTTHPKGE